MFWKKYYSKKPKSKNNQLEQERTKVQNYQEETFYILQKLKQMKTYQISLEQVKTKQFSAYLQNSFSPRHSALTLVSEQTLRSLFFLNKKMCNCYSPRSPFRSRPRPRGADAWVENFVRNLQDDRWKFDASLFEAFRKKINRDFAEIKELHKEMKVKADYEEEILVLKNQIMDLSDQLNQSQLQFDQQLADKQRQIGELEQTNQDLVDEMKLLKQRLQSEQSLTGWVKRSKWLMAENRRSRQRRI